MSLRLDPVVPMNSRNLLNQVDFLFDVNPVRRHLDSYDALRLSNCTHLEIPEKLQHPRRSQLGSEHTIDPVWTHRDNTFLDLLWIDVKCAFKKIASSSFEHEFGCAIQCVTDPIGIRASLEPLRCVGADAEGFCSATDGSGIPIGAFKDYVHGRVIDFGILSTHDPGERHLTLLVAHHYSAGRKLVFLPVEGNKLCPFRSLPDNNAFSLRECIIKRMHWLSALKHDVVRHIHDVVPRTQSDIPESLLEPLWRWSDLHSADHPCREPSAVYAVLNMHAQETANRCRALLESDFRQCRSFPGKRPNLSCDSHVTQPIGSVGCYFHIKCHVIKAKVLCQRLAWLCLRIKNHDSAGVGTEVKFRLSANHSKRLHSPKLNAFKLKGLAIGLVHILGNHRTNQPHGHLLPRSNVRGAAHDLQRFFPDIHLTDGKSVRVGMLLPIDDVSHHESFVFLSKKLHALEFQPGHRQPFHQ